MIGFALALLVAVMPPASAGRAGTADDSSQVRQLTPEQRRDQVNAFLGVIDTRVSAAQWRSLGPDANPLLEEIASDPETLPTRRARAIAGLAALCGPRAPTLMRTLATSESQPLVVRFAAVRGLGQITAPVQIQDTLAPILESAGDARVRAVAAEQLGLRARRGSCGLVRAQIARESADARPLFHRAAANCGEPEAR